jgi:hypothetical protein
MIIRASMDDLTPQALSEIEQIFKTGFKGELVKREFSWKAFIQYWEFAFRLPWNALWFSLGEDNETILGLIGGTCFPAMLTGQPTAVETCWRTSPFVKGKGLGWDLLATFIEWAIVEQRAERIVTHRFLHEDVESDDRYDTKIKQMGFFPSGCEYYMDVKR